MERQRLKPENKWLTRVRHSTKLLTLICFKLKQSSTKTKTEIFWFQEIQTKTELKN